jgi:hypothetical protein
VKAEAICAGASWRVAGVSPLLAAHARLLDGAAGRCVAWRGSNCRDQSSWPGRDRTGCECVCAKPTETAGRARSGVNQSGSVACQSERFGRCCQFPREADCQTQSTHSSPGRGSAESGHPQIDVFCEARFGMVDESQPADDQVLHSVPVKKLQQLFKVPDGVHGQCAQRRRWFARPRSTARTSAWMATNADRRSSGDRLCQNAKSHRSASAKLFARCTTIRRRRCFARSRSPMDDHFKRATGFTQSQSRRGLAL